MNDQKFIDKLKRYLVKDIHDAYARSTNLFLRAKPKSLDTKSDLIYKRVFGVLF